MLTLICNSSESFFNYYVSQFSRIIEDKNLFVNSRLNIEGIVSSRSKKAASIKWLILDIPLLFRMFTVKDEVVVFLSLHPLNYFQQLILKVRRKKIIQIIHDPVAHPDSKSFLVNFITRLLCLNADRVILHSEYYLKEYRQKYKDVKTLPLFGYDVNFQSKSLNKSLLLFGRIEPYKGLANIIQYLDNDIFNDWKIIIAGKGTLPQELHGRPNVEIHNRYIPDRELQDLIRQASFVFLPYDSATQSAVVLHSFSLSTPVICHDVGALSEYVDNSRGLIFTKNDFVALQRFLTTINSSVYQDMVRGVEDYFSHMFDKKKLRTQIMSVFDMSKESNI